MTQKKDIIEPDSEKSIQESYDEVDGDPSFVIADVTTDDAWLAVSVGDEVQVDEKR